MRASYPAVLSTLLLSFALAACDIPGQVNQPSAAKNTVAAKDACGPELNPEGPGSGDAASHGVPSYDESGQVSSDGNGGFRATRTVSIANDFGGAMRASMQIDTENGDIGHCVREGGGYRINIMLEGRGSTEQQARDALDGMVVTHNDELSEGELRLATRVEFVNPIVGSNVQQSASVLAGLPSAPTYSLTSNTSNGSIAAAGFNGPRAEFQSANGNLGLQGVWDEAALDTSNGNIILLGNIAGSLAATSNGSVIAELEAERSGNHLLQAGNGNVDVKLTRTATPGLDLSASASNGNATIEVSGTEPVGEQQQSNAHFRSPDFDTNEIKIVVDAITTNGNASIHE